MEGGRKRGMERMITGIDAEKVENGKKVAVASDFSV